MASSLLQFVASNDYQNVQEYVNSLNHQDSSTLHLLKYEITSSDHGGRNSLSPLHTAALRGYVDILRLLLGAGVNPNVGNDQGDTPLHVAADLGRVDAVQVLLSAGADATVMNNFGSTAARKAHPNDWDSATVRESKSQILELLDAEDESLDEFGCIAESFGGSLLPPLDVSRCIDGHSLSSSRRSAIWPRISPCAPTGSPSRRRGGQIC